MTSKNNKKPKTKEQLAKLYQSLDPRRQQSLSDFADFLLSKAPPVVKEIAEPLNIERPEQETVVGAVKRLKKNYPMIESMSVFSEASALMTQHMIKGRDSVEVIDEMETLFKKAHQQILNEHNANK